MLAVVTGASGHLGANLVRSLIDRKWQVRALIRNDTRALEGLDIEFAYGDVLDEERVVADDLTRGGDGLHDGLGGLPEVVDRRRGLSDADDAVVLDLDDDVLDGGDLGACDAEHPVGGGEGDGVCGELHVSVSPRRNG